ncbi:putative acyl-CoA transferase/carnitine dehydratase [Frankia canadensis]|uniref:Putative acyl-CoA transferase/carnitine dehydratase n=1 Tax=Frankia canadensis TaxID=1836972 RepID=A0A2I2KIX6_9ACTN|nr:CoA transferase [Frankia canadensis]SNQ45597.1 putative acyl-CoA transferase/carnitine dehydratase [Frankia canadensis]SOU52887.1 putative acyl-CoA transferase/carnitine dehydratase [Frankia canadensis]
MRIQDGVPARPAASDPPLRGLRVLDTATLYAGPFISTLLADHGADVIKVEPPGGDPYRARAMWPILARDKRSITLNLRSEEGCELLRQLARHVDVLVVNMLPGQLERRGLTWERLSAINPDLVLVCVTSFGLDGPNAELPGSGTLGEAFAGLTHLTGDPADRPMLASVPLGDAVTGMVGAFGVLAACLSRANGGPGRVVDVNPVDALLHVAAPALAEWTPGEPAPGRLAGRLAGSPVRNTYRCKDGTWVAISCSTSRHLTELLDLVGYRDDEEEDVIGDADGGAIDRAVAAWAARSVRAEILAVMNARRLPVVPVHDAASLTDDPHAQARRAVRTVDSQDVGPRLVPAPAPRFGPRAAAADGSAVPDAPRRCPDMGEHTAEVLGGLLGLDDERLAGLRREGVI